MRRKRRREMTKRTGSIQLRKSVIANKRTSSVSIVLRANAPKLTLFALNNGLFPDDPNPVIEMAGQMSGHFNYGRGDWI